METLRITLFGRLAVRRDTTVIELPAKAAELLCYLLLARGRPQTREVLATELWSSVDEAQGKKYLRKTLWQLQQLLDGSDTDAPHLLEIDQSWVAVSPAAALQVDTHRLECAGIALSGHSPEGLNITLVTQAMAAIECYQDDLLVGWYQDWCMAERERYQSIYFALTDVLMDHFASIGRFDEGTDLGLRLLRHDPTRERTYRRLMRLATLAGDRGAALRQFDRCVDALQRTFGILPAAATLALADRIRAGDLDNPVPEAEATALKNLSAELKCAQAHIRALQHDLIALKESLGVAQCAYEAGTLEETFGETSLC